MKKFQEDHVPKMREYPQRMIILIIDFDEDRDRLNNAENQIPNDLKERVFVVGVLSESEKLRSDIKMNFEEIGETLARDCSDNTNKL